MRKQFIPGLLIITASFLCWQGCQAPGRVSGGNADAASTINDKEAYRIISTLASDEMRGRKIYSPEIDKAADFIAAEFKTSGLHTWNNSATHRQDFAMVRARSVSVNGNLDGTALEAKNIIVVTCQPKLKINQDSGFEIASIKAGDNLNTVARNYVRANKNLLVICDKKHAGSFSNLARLKNNLFKSDKHVVFVLADAVPARYEVEAVHEITEQRLANVVGVLEGKSKKNEYVIFSGHYDHLGTGKPVNGDSIYNGANDDASGVTAMMMLARYFKEKNNNERTLLFVAFTAEESGGFGSQYFSRQMDPANIMAMFNIEMIGTDSKWGKNSAFITGFEKSNLGTILQKNLEGSGFAFYPDPYTAEQLFYRSDNATLARLGVPAHTISTAKMESEPHYHQLTDEVKTLDMQNMAMIVKAIAMSAETIIKGVDTPSRVNVSELR